MELKNEMKKLYNEKEKINSFMRKYFYCAKKNFFFHLSLHLKEIRKKRFDPNEYLYKENSFYCQFFSSSCHRKYD